MEEQQNKRQKTLDVSYLAENPDMTIACGDKMFEVDKHKIESSFNNVESKSAADSSHVRLCLLFAQNPHETWDSLSKETVFNIKEMHGIMRRWEAKRSFELQFIALILDRIKRRKSYCDRLLMVGKMLSSFPKFDGTNSGCPWQLLQIMLIFVHAETYDFLMGTLLSVRVGGSTTDDSFDRIFQTLTELDNLPQKFGTLSRQIYGIMPAKFSHNERFGTVQSILELIRTSGFCLCTIEKYKTERLVPNNWDRKQIEDDDDLEISKTVAITNLITKVLDPSLDLFNNMLDLRKLILPVRKELVHSRTNVGALFTEDFANTNISLCTTDIIA